MKKHQNPNSPESIFFCCCGFVSLHWCIKTVVSFLFDFWKSVDDLLILYFDEHFCYDYSNWEHLHVKKNKNI